MPTNSASSLSIDDALASARRAASEGMLTASALENLTAWLTQPRYGDYRTAILDHIQAADWKKLDDVFWTIIPFGTGGRRGRMFPFGSNAINERTIGESAQGLATYILEVAPDKQNLRCAIAYDTRHRSREFAELCAGIMVANGFEVHFLDQYRATPQLSFAVRHRQCDCGIMVTASHNPPSDNAVKVYWSTGGQVLPPHDKAIIDRVMKVDEIKRADFQQALGEERIKICTQEIDEAFVAEVTRFAWPGPRDAKIIFSPLHGVGAFAVMPVLEAGGFTEAEVFKPHEEPSGDFPNVPGHISNPENPAVFDAIIERARKSGADVILATDPDCDRMGVAAPLTMEPDSGWATLNGNQIGALLTDYICSRMQEMGMLTPKSYIVKTLVTSELSRRIAERYGVRCEGNLHVGFKWIAGVMDSVGPEYFVFGTEESHGYLVGQYARDKDASVACLLMSQLVAQLKQENKTLHQKLDELLVEHGCHMERLVNVQMEGSEGMVLMDRLMETFRSAPPRELAGIEVACARDYQALVTRFPDGSLQQLNAPAANMVILDLAKDGNYFAIRPSGTEPKVKFYMFAYSPPAESRNLAEAKQRLEERLSGLEADIRAYAADAVTQPGSP